MKMKYILLALFMNLLFIGNIHALTFEEVTSDISVHGFISQGYLQSQDNNYLANKSSDGTFGFNEIGINFSKKLYNNLRIGIQLFSYDLGAIGNNDVTIDWAFADYRWQEWLGLRVGIIKAPHGLYNESRDMDMLRTSVFLPGSVYTELNRSTMTSLNGIGFYGDVPAGPVGSLSYYLLAGTMDVDGDLSVGAVREWTDTGVWDINGDLEFDHIYIAAIDWYTPLEGLRLKWTYRTSELTFPGVMLTDFGMAPLINIGDPINFEMEKHVTYVYSVEYTWKDLVLAAEYSQIRSEWSVPEIARLPFLGVGFSEQLSKRHGYYASAAYRFNDWFEAGTYYSKYYADSDDKDGSSGEATGMYRYDYQAWLEDFALSLRFDINQYWVAKIEGHLMDGAALCLNMDNDDFEEDWYMIAAKLSFSF